MQPPDRPGQNVDLPHGWTMTIHTTPDSLAALRRHALGATLYAVCGHDDEARSAAYIGESGRLDDSRAAISFTKWARTLGAIKPTALVLVHAPEPATWAIRRYIEAETIRSLTQTSVIFNSQSGCSTGRAMLKRTHRLLALAVARSFADALHIHVLGQPIEPPIASTNNREALIRIIRTEHHRALTTAEVHTRAVAAGVDIRGETPLFTVRRDLAIREKTDGVPRVRTCLVNGTRVYYSPAIPKRTAIEGYLASRRTQRRIA